LGGGCQLLADMKEIAQKMALRPEDFPGLQPSPLGPVPHCVNLALQPPARVARAVAPAPPHLGHLAKWGGVKCFLFALSLCGGQPHFLPVPRPFAVSFARGHRADHRSIDLGHDVRGSHRGQYAKGLLIVFLKLF
jgi:hypothetical protein